MVKWNVIFHKFSITFHVIEQMPYPVLRGYNAIVQRKNEREERLNQNNIQIDFQPSILGYLVIHK